MKKISWKNKVTVEISQKNFEKFINECKNENIILSSVKYTDDGPICSMSFSDFRSIRHIAKKCGVRLKIIKKNGFGFFVRLHKKRYGFYFGAVLAICILMYLTSCIWVIDIEGNDTTDESRILEVLGENGIYIGAFRFGHDLSDIKNRSLIKLDSLSWMWVSLDGTRALVDVREKGENVLIHDKTTPVNLVASWPGIIYDMQVRSGRKIVARGDTVQKGDLLVSGIAGTAAEGNRYIASTGTVTARTWRTIKDEYHHTQITEEKTGNKHKNTTVNIFGKDLPWKFGGKMKFKNYTVRSEVKNIKLLKNFYLPISFTTETFYEIITKKEILDDNVVISEAVESLTNKIKSMRADDSVTLKRTYSYETLANGNLSIAVTLESLENIAKPVEIEVTDSEEIDFGEDN